MIALRDFRYQNLETGQVMEVRKGQTVGEDVLRHHRDPQVLVRTKYVASEGETVVAAPVPRKRGRPKKTA